jgi:2-C-methyl-D-erythritol 4-phosphate cytidylyltransferase/2-C-methyl-D-erythritol 2,4-cyclodiphosphate synthase
MSNPDQPSPAPQPRPRIAAILLADTLGATLMLAGRPVLRHAAAALGAVDLLQPVGNAAALEGLPHLPPVPAGHSRAASIRAGLEALAPHAPDVVLVHDGARPVVTPAIIASLLDALEDAEGAVPALLASGVLTRDAAGDARFRPQTPQAFRYAILRDAYRQAWEEPADDATLLAQAGYRVALVPGHDDNILVKDTEDLVPLRRMMRLPRTGTGYDVHAFAEARPLVLCGVTVPHDRGLTGHSDADVGIHALCDAIYGALAEGDIGRHFPPSEAQWKDADSARFLRHAAERIAARGGELANADVTLICERPKIAPHADAMRARLAELLDVPVSRISVKATTTERLGFTGRMEGIAAQAAATVLLPD